ncbi:MAG: O-antigen ligase family protein [Fibrobacterales bacterium]
MRLLQLLIFLIPFQNHPLLSMNILPRFTPIKLIGVMALFYSFQLIAKNKKRQPIDFISGLFLSFTFSQLILSLFWHSTVGPDAIKSLVSFLVFYITAITIISNPQKIDRIFWACIIAMAWSSLYMYKEYILLKNVFVGFRPRGSFGDSNYYCIAAILVLPMARSLYTTVAGKQRYIVLALGLLIVGGMMVAQSRGGMLGLGIIIGIYLLHSTQKLRSAILTVLICTIGLLFMPDNFWTRLEKGVSVKETTEVAGDDLSNKRRIELPRAGLLMYSANPILGVGLGNYKSQSAIYNPILWEINGPGVAHNTYIEILGETGTLGSLLFLGILFFTISTLNTIIRHHRDSIIISSQALALKVGIYGYAFTAIFLTAQYSKFYWLVLFIAIALKRYVVQYESSFYTTERNKQ